MDGKKEWLAAVPEFVMTHCIYLLTKAMVSASSRLDLLHGTVGSNRPVPFALKLHTPALRPARNSDPAAGTGMPTDAATAPSTSPTWANQKNCPSNACSRLRPSLSVQVTTQ